MKVAIHVKIGEVCPMIIRGAKTELLIWLSCFTSMAVRFSLLKNDAMHRAVTNNESVGVLLGLPSKPDPSRGLIVHDAKSVFNADSGPSWTRRSLRYGFNVRHMRSCL